MLEEGAKYAVEKVAPGLLPEVMPMVTLPFELSGDTHGKTGWSAYCNNTEDGPQGWGGPIRATQEEAENDRMGHAIETGHTSVYLRHTD